MVSKKYRVVAKVGDNAFAKWKVNNLFKFAQFLDAKYPDWRWFNVYLYTKAGDGNQVGNFTKNRRPMSAYISQ